MGNKLVTTAEVEQDLEAAYGWYENQRAGLGEDLLDRIDACIQGILRNPGMSATIMKNYRRALVQRFPYAIYDEYSKNVVTIHCIFHTSRDPRTWQKRLP